MNKITIATLSAILAGLLVLGGITIFDDKIYYCEYRSIVMACDRLSSTGKTCYNSNVGNKRCLESPYWIEVEKDFEPIEIIPTQQTNAKQWLCNQERCIAI